MRKAFVALLLVLPFASALDCVPKDCGGNLLCSIAGLPEALKCALVNAVVEVLAAPLRALLELARFFVTTTPPLASDSGRALFELVGFIASLLLFLALLLDGIKLAWASAFSEEERVQAKEGVKRTVFSMLVVWLGFDLYAMAVDAGNSFASAIAPSQSEWLAASGSSVSNLVLLAFLVPAIAFFVFSAFGRWLFSFMGFTLFVVALAFECFPLTGGIGRALKKLVAANFVVQILQAIFMKIAASSFSGMGAVTGWSDAAAQFAVAGGVLFIASVASTAVYFAAVVSGAVSGILSSGAGKALVYYGVLRRNHAGK